MRVVPGIVLLGQAEQHEVSRVARRKARHLDVVVQQAIGCGERMVRAAEELLLMVVARPPRQHRADVQRFAAHLPHHVVGSDTLRRVLVVRAPRRVHVVVAGVVAELRRIDPAPQRHVDATRRCRPVTSSVQLARQRTPGPALYDTS